MKHPAAQQIEYEIGFVKAHARGRNPADGFPDQLLRLLSPGHGCEETALDATGFGTHRRRTVSGHPN